MNSIVEENRAESLDVQLAADVSPVNSKSGVLSKVHIFDISLQVEKSATNVILMNGDPNTRVKFAFLIPKPNKDMEKAAYSLGDRLRHNYDFASYVYTMYAGGCIPIVSPRDADDLFREYQSMNS